MFSTQLLLRTKIAKIFSLFGEKLEVESPGRHQATFLCCYDLHAKGKPSGRVALSGDQCSLELETDRYQSGQTKAGLQGPQEEAGSGGQAETQGQEGCSLQSQSKDTKMFLLEEN